MFYLKTTKGEQADKELENVQQYSLLLQEEKLLEGDIDGTKELIKDAEEKLAQ